jgi:predicted transcriptional regulator
MWRHVMARASWFDDNAQHPLIHEQIEKLETFTRALADGQVSKQELSGQEQRLVSAMKALEPELSDALHAKVTTVLVELSAYNVMRLLHELQAERVKMAFGNA